jgi:putative flippase GtrA
MCHRILVAGRSRHCGYRQLREGRTILAPLQRLLRVRIVRYALVGGIGIPVHDAALFVFLTLFGARLFPLASVCAFEVSTTVNFVLNQLYTYSEQKHLRGWDWVGRALKAQVTSLSALAIAFAIGLALVYGLHLNAYLANDIGIVCSFFYNFTISNRLVFRPAPSTGSTSTENA